jgi:hypothetical protein
MIYVYITMLVGFVLEVQTNWYTGPGNIGPVSHWEAGFDTSEHIACGIPNQVSLSPSDVDTADWSHHIIESNLDIDGHNFIVPADMDLDEDCDFVGCYSHFIVWYEQVDTLNFVKHTIDNDFSMGSHGTVWPWDMDQDGDSDLVVSGKEGLAWFENNGLLFVRFIISSDDWYYARLADIENDGDMDIVAQKGKSSGGVLWEGPLYIFENDGSMNFTSRMIPDADTTWRTNFADFNNDGFIDIQTSSYNARNVRVYLNDGTGQFNLVYRYDGERLDGSWPSDLNADGFMDVSANAHNGDFFWLENDGTGEDFTYHAVSNGLGKYGDGGMAVDIDLSGSADIIGGYEAIGWFEQVSDSDFVEHCLGSASSCHWVYGYNTGNGPCDEVVDISMDILYTDKGLFGLYKNRMIKGYEDHAWLESAVLDAGEVSTWLRFGWHDCVPDGYTVDYRVRCGSSMSDIASASWSDIIAFSGDSLIETLVKARYFQYRIEIDDSLGTADGVAFVDTVWVEYELHPVGLEESGRKAALSISSTKVNRATISYTLTEEAVISFKVYDMAGRLVGDMAKKRRQASTYVMPWDFRSGVYFVDLRLGQNRMVEKCVVIQ